MEGEGVAHQLWSTEATNNELLDEARIHPLQFLLRLTSTGVLLVVPYELLGV